MARVTYTATDRSGRTYTRTSDSMHYAAMSLARGSWHLTRAAAAKAGDPVPAVPTAISGRVRPGEFDGHPSAAAIAALIAAKDAAAAAKAAPRPPRTAAKRAAVEAEPTRAPRILLDPYNAAQPFELADQPAAAPVSDGGPLGHLCDCLSSVADFTISHGAECPASTHRIAAEVPTLF
jgi:hypothetical protein